MFPGACGTARQNINCRCTVLYDEVGAKVPVRPKPMVVVEPVQGMPEYMQTPEEAALANHTTEFYGTDLDMPARKAMEQALQAEIDAWYADSVHDKDRTRSSMHIAGSGTFEYAVTPGASMRLSRGPNGELTGVCTTHIDASGRLVVDFLAASPTQAGYAAGRRLLAEEVDVASAAGKTVVLHPLVKARSFYSSCGMKIIKGESGIMGIDPAQGRKFADKVLRPSAAVSAPVASPSVFEYGANIDAEDRKRMAAEYTEEILAWAKDSVHDEARTQSSEQVALAAMTAFRDNPGAVLRTIRDADGNLVGVAVTHRSATIMNLDFISAAPTEAGRGMGRALMMEAAKEASTNGVGLRCVPLEGSRPVFESWGMKPIGSTNRYSFTPKQAGNFAGGSGKIKPPVKKETPEVAALKHTIEVLGTDTTDEMRKAYAAALAKEVADWRAASVHDQARTDSSEMVALAALREYETHPGSVLRILRGPNGELTGVVVSHRSATVMNVDFMAASPAAVGAGAGRRMLAETGAEAADNKVGLRLVPTEGSRDFFTSMGMRWIGDTNRLSFTPKQAGGFAGNVKAGNPIGTTKKEEPKPEPKLKPLPKPEPKKAEPKPEPKKGVVESGAEVAERIRTEVIAGIDEARAACERAYERRYEELREVSRIAEDRGLLQYDRAPDLRERMKRVEQAEVDARKALKDLTRGATARAHEILTVERAPGTDDFEANFSGAKPGKDAKRNVEKALAFIHKISTITGREVYFDGKEQVRANAQPGQIEYGVGGKTRWGSEIKPSDVETLVHEMGHELEFMRRSRPLAKLDDVPAPSSVVDFLKGRWGSGERLPVGKLLNSVLKTTGFRADEVCEPDDLLGFASGATGDRKREGAYAGKIYRSGRDVYATEAISIGVEWLYKDPVQFLRADPDYFAFVVDFVRGNK